MIVTIHLWNHVPVTRQNRILRLMNLLYMCMKKNMDDKFNGYGFGVEMTHI